MNIGPNEFKNLPLAAQSLIRTALNYAKASEDALRRSDVIRKQLYNENRRDGESICSARMCKIIDNDSSRLAAWRDMEMQHEKKMKVHNQLKEMYDIHFDLDGTIHQGW